MSRRGLLRMFLREADNAMGALLRILPNKRRANKKEPEEWICVKLWGLGDTALILPHILRNSNCKILTTKRVLPLFEALNLKQKLVKLHELLRKDYGVIDCEQELNAPALFYPFASKIVGFEHKNTAKLLDVSVPFDPGKHMFEVYGDLFEAAGLKRAEIPKITQNANSERKRNNIYINTRHGGNAVQREYPYWDTVIRGLLSELPDTTIYVDGQTNVQDPRVLLVTDLPFKKRIRMLQESRLLITIDTGLLHIASLLDVPTVALFGPQTPKRYGSLATKHVNIYHEWPCSPCILDYLGKIPKKCPIAHPAPCMASIDPAEVIEAALSIM